METLGVLQTYIKSTIKAFPTTLAIIDLFNVLFIVSVQNYVIHRINLIYLRTKKDKLVLYVTKITPPIEKIGGYLL